MSVDNINITTKINKLTMLELELIPKNENEDSTFIQIEENTYDEIKSIFEFIENEFENKVNDFEKYIIWSDNNLLDIVHLD